MKKIFLLLFLGLSATFGFNFNGTWINKSVANFNDPIKLTITNSNIVRPYIKRSGGIAKLKAKRATKTGNELFEAWGFGNKNLVLLIKPINRFKIRVIVKKIDVAKRKIITKSFIFANQKRKNYITYKKRFLGVWKSTSPFSALSKIQISQINDSIYIKAWRRDRSGIKYMGKSKAKIINGKLKTTWQKGNLYVTSTISGYKLNANGRYETIKMDLRATNLVTDITNSQTIYFKRKHFYNPPIKRPQIKHIKVGPLDINLLIKSY
jgi:hypothetical protein